MARLSLPLVLIAIFGLVGFTVFVSDLPLPGTIPILIWMNFLLELGLFVLLGWAFHRDWPLRVYHSLAVVILVLFCLGDMALQLLLPRDFSAMYLGTLNGLAFSLLILPAPTAAKLGIPALTVCFNLVLLYTYKTFPHPVPHVIAFSLVSMFLAGTFLLLTMNRMMATERFHREAASESLRFKQILADLTFEAVVIVRQGVVVEFNRAFLELTGLRLEQVQNRPLTEVLSLLTQIPFSLREVAVPSLGPDYQAVMLRDRSGDSLQGLSARQRKDRVETLGLTKREKEITTCVLDGKTRANIARELFISEETVKTHLAHIYEKLDITNRVDLIRLILEASTES